jgi:hypothetical protein
MPLNKVHAVKTRTLRVAAYFTFYALRNLADAAS